ncbi:MAG: hypothetical protein WCP33_02850 [Deltaproteobacteria bacterium]
MNMVQNLFKRSIVYRIIIVLLLYTTIVRADSLTLADGSIKENIKITAVEPNGVRFNAKDGAGTIPFDKLSNAEKAKYAPKPPKKTDTTIKEPSDNINLGASFVAEKCSNSVRSDADSQVETDETPVARYKAKVYRAIGSRWYIYVNRDSGLVGTGIVRIKFFIRSDGTITEMQILEGQQLSGLLAISRRSIGEVSGQLEPFPQSMKDKLGNGYWENVSFTITGKGS